MLGSHHARRWSGTGPTDDIARPQPRSNTRMSARNSSASASHSVSHSAFAPPLELAPLPTPGGTSTSEGIGLTPKARLPSCRSHERVRDASSHRIDGHEPPNVTVSQLLEFEPAVSGGNLAEPKYAQAVRSSKNAMSSLRDRFYLISVRECHRRCDALPRPSRWTIMRPRVSRQAHPTRERIPYGVARRPPADHV